MIFQSRFRMASIFLFAIGLISLAKAAGALTPKQEAGSLESLAFVSEPLQASHHSETLDELRVAADAAVLSTWDSFRGMHGDWSAIVDKRTGKVESAEGEGIPFVPGRGNQLQKADLSVDLGDNRDIGLAQIEAMTRAFLPRVAGLLGVDPSALVLNQGRSGHPAEYLWFVDFDVIRHGMPIEGARVVFRVNNGNLIQFGSENLPAEGVETPKAKVTRDQALTILATYIGGFSAADSFMDGGSRHLIPVALMDSKFAEGFERGKGRGLARVWQFVFRRDGDYGTWRARVDATTGTLLELRDLNDYASAQVAGGVTSLTGTETRPMPFADVSSGGYANSAGVYNYTGGTVSSTLNGQYVKINDSCGAISLTSDASGNLAFGTSSGVDCQTPGYGGAGNTNASRTQFYHLNRAKEIVRGWLNLPWLTSQLTANVNLPDNICNAFWDGTALNFVRSGTGCSNSGQIQGVGLHEFGHGLDANDGNGLSPDKGTGETYADWTAALITHNSCIGGGYLASNCNGYGDACTSCTGVRDIDYAKHSSGTPHTVGNFTQVLCPPGNGYPGPCGREGHCESQVSSEALWDLAVRDLPSPGTASAWAIMDRLWYLSRPTATAAFTCFKTNSPWTSDGCGTGSLWKTMRAVDDDDGNLSNGTPHSAALYAAFNRHGIACTSDAGANTNFRSCTGPAAPPNLSLAASNNQVKLSVSGVIYDVYRNEQGCEAGGFIKIANDLTSLSFTDSNVANDFTYFYKVVNRWSTNEACASATSACLEASPCSPPAPPASVTATVVSLDQVDLSWTDSSGSPQYHIYRTTDPNPGATYTLIGIQSGTTFSDTGLSSCTPYYYVVRAARNETCESVDSIRVEANTGGSCLMNISKHGEGTVTSSPAGINCGTDCSETYPYNTQVTLTAAPAAGYTHSWGYYLSSCDGAATCTVTMTQNFSPSVRFLLPELFVTVIGDGIVTSTPAGINTGGGDYFQLYYYNTQVTLTATPAVGSVFNQWSRDCTGTGTCTVAMTKADYRVRAEFSVATYALSVSLAGAGSGTVTSTPAGINCGADCSETYNYNTSVTLTTTPAEGSVFSGWSGACTGTGSCVVTMDQAKSVTATFDKGQDFYAVSPCRVYDTRVTGTPLASEVPRIINVAGTCGVPATATAVSLNLTAIMAPGQGFITLYPGDIALPGTWTSSFPSLLNRANNAVIPLAWNGDGTLAALAVISGGGSMHIALDVTGYFE